MCTKRTRKNNYGRRFLGLCKECGPEYTVAKLSMDLNCNITSLFSSLGGPQRVPTGTNSREANKLIAYIKYIYGAGKLYNLSDYAIHTY